MNNINNNNFSYWMRTNLLSSSQGLITQDIDYIIMYKGLIIIEEKISINGSISAAQAVIYKLLNDIFINLDNFGLFLIYSINNNFYINPELIKNGNKYKIDIAKSSYYNKSKVIDMIKNLEIFKLKSNWADNVVKGLFEQLKDCHNLTSSIYSTANERTFQRITHLNNISKNQITIDWIFVNYCTGYFSIIIEKEKSNGKYILSEKEKLLFSKINELLEKYSSNNVKNPKTNVNYKYLGFYILEFEKTNPDNGACWLNGKEINNSDLKKFLNLNSEKSFNISKIYNTLF